MKRIILTFTMIIALTLLVNAQTWKADNAHSSVSFTISHLLISEVTGNFKTFNVTANADDNFNNLSLEGSVEAMSIDTDNSMRDKHLKSPDFFDTDKFKHLTFKSTSYKKLDDKNFIVKGLLTIRGISKNVTCKGKIMGTLKDPHSGELKAGLKLSTEIKREDFNIGKGMMSIGDTVEIIVRLEMNRQ